MAEVALTSMAKIALQLFTSLAKDEFLLLWKSRKELQSLQSSMETISCLLQDADKLQSKEDSVQNCLSNLRKVMYDAEDFFDALASKALHEKIMTGNVIKKEVQLFFSKSTNQLCMVFKIAHEVKSLRESLDGIKRDMDLCGFVRRPLPVINQQVVRVDRERTHSFIHKKSVIGREQDRDRIITMILSHDQEEVSFDDRSFSVVAIIGFGGLGKTTLAQFVYNNDSVKEGFEVCLWACINYLSNLEHVLIEIIASKEGRHCELGLERLQERLRALIGGKKFLVVLDDVWDDNPLNWRKLKTILCCGNIGSKVLVTTRSRKVAECLDSPKPCCVNLEVLSEESAWSLFVKNAFNYEGEVSKYPQLESLRKKIVKRCGNVPLAIIFVGRLLRNRKKDVRIWSEFLDNELGKTLSINDCGKTQEDVKDVLMVSYNDLLPEVKLCFAYCSLFPKDYDFQKDELVRLWLAQGFISSSSNDNAQSLEDEADAYFFHLVDRSFFQEVKEYHGEYTAKMHDLVHDVAIDVSKTESVLLDKDSINMKKRDSLRHISIDSEVEGSLDYQNLVSDPNTVRTLLYHPSYRLEKNSQISQCSLDMSLMSFKMLRTLHLQDLGVIHLSSCIGELIHLRYLDLSHNRNLKHLPKSVCKLHHLRTLVLRYCIRLERLPPKIEKLVSLRQLYIEGCNGFDCLPLGLTSLTSLVNLDRMIVHPQRGGLGYLEGLVNLCGVLEIGLPKEGWPYAVEDAKRSNISKKHKLNGVVIDWEVRGSNNAQKMGKDEAKAVLEALEPHQSLEHLTIRNYGGQKLPGWFCMLENVREILLDGCECVEYIEDVMNDNLFLRSLETLDFRGMKSLKGWWRQEIPEEIQRRPCIAKVSRVTIEGCPKLKGRMPLFEGMEYLRLDIVDAKLVTELLPNVNLSCSPHSSYMGPFGINCANNKLKEVEFCRIEGLLSLPKECVSHLTALQSLRIRGCKGLQWVSRHGLSHLTALKQLNLTSDECEIGDEDEVYVGMPWKALQRLETLKLAVGDWHLLEGLAYLSCLTDLDIGKWKGVQFGDGETTGVQLPLIAMQNLRNLEIGFDETSICHLPTSGIEHLHFLRNLRITGCKELYLGWKTLLITMKLTSLRFYCVGSVINVEDHLVVDQPTQLRLLVISQPKETKWVHHIPWKSLTSLESLEFEEIQEMEELPNEIQHLTPLRRLWIVGCDKLISIPTWLPHLTSLKYLMILNCPEGLERRCTRERGEDWPLIRHIHEIEIMTR